MSKYSPGPWSCVTREKTSLIFSAGREPIAKVCINADGSRLANEKLITAAPDLLGACKSALRALKDNLEPGCMDADAIAGLEAAIAKAEGA